jgi:hypothetical protein
MTVSPSPEQLSEHARAMRGQLNDELPNGVGNTMDALCDALESTQAEIARLTTALNALQQAEATYRYAHDVLGAGDTKTGRAWDLLKRAGDNARAALKDVG